MTATTTVTARVFRGCLARVCCLLLLSLSLPLHADQQSGPPAQLQSLDQLAYSAPAEALAAVDAQIGSDPESDIWLNIIAARALYYLNRFSDSQSRLIAVEIEIEGKQPDFAAVLTQRMMGQNFFRMGALDQAMRQALKAERIASQLELNSELAQIKNLIAAVHLRSDDHQKALNAFSESLQHFRQSGSPADIAKLNNNLAAVHIELDQLDQATIHLDAAMSLARELNRPSTLIAALVNRVELKARLGEFEAAAKALTDCLETARNSTQQATEVWCLEAGVELHERQGNISLAIELSRQALSMAQSQSMIQSAVDIGERLARLLASDGQPEAALEISTRNLENIRRIKDDVIQIRLDEVNALNDAVRTRDELMLARKENQLQSERQIWLWAAFLVLVPLLALAVLLLRSKQKLVVNLNQEQARTQDAMNRMEGALEENKRLARTDPLTGLDNRREMMGRIQKLYDRNEPDRQGVLMMIDIDRFKGINDHFGHQAGDRVLTEIASSLQSFFVDPCSMARWGGEEFIVLMPGIDAIQAERKAREYCELIASSPISHEQDAISVTVSIGVCQLQQAHSLKDWIRQADEAMYASKKAGRNRVSVFDQSMS